jgi:hypothetical protein
MSKTRCSISLAVREMQIKTWMSYSYPSILTILTVENLK